MTDMTENAGKIRECICSALLVFVCFIFYFVWSLHLPMDLSPDEYIRYQIPVWIFEHGKLPVGNELELINNVWGFSYGFVPYTPSLVSVFFMFLISIFTNSSETLFHAARFPNVLFGAGTVLLCLLIGKEFFRRKETKYLFAALVGFLPQFAFLSSYLNNDCFAVFCSAIILLAWVRGVKYTWSIKNCVLLSIGIGLTAISYYNAYGWILCSIFLVFFSIFCNKTLEKKLAIFLRVFFVVFCISFAIAGWFFLRNFIIHDGDIFGLRSCDLCGEQNARFDLKPSNRSTPKNQGLAFDSIFFSTAWHKSTIRSFFCVLGYMNIFADDYVYAIYFMFIIVGIVAFVLNARIYFPSLSKGLLPILIACMIIPYVLSMYRSWSTDYQPQGRYVMPALLPLQFFVALGYESLFGKIKKIKPFSATFCSIISYLILFFVVFSSLIYPKCFGKTVLPKPFNKSIFNSYRYIDRDFLFSIDTENLSAQSLVLGGWAYYENDKCDVYIGITDKIFKTHMVHRPDVKSAFGLKSDTQGFSMVIQLESDLQEYTLYLVNKTRKEIYKKTISISKSDDLDEVFSNAADVE